MQGQPENTITMYTITTILNKKLEDNPAAVKGYILYNKSEIIAILYGEHTTMGACIMGAVDLYVNNSIQVIWDTLQLDIQFSVSNTCSTLSGLPALYRESANMLKYRLYKDVGQILYASAFEEPAKRAIHFYPDAIEKRLTGNLAANNLPGTEEDFREFVSYICQSNSYNYIDQSYQMLLSAIILSFQAHGGNMQDLLESNLSGQLRECRTSAEICSWFTGVLFPLYSNLRRHIHNEQSKSAILAITNYINNHIRDDITLLACADLVGMSPSHVSRLFHKTMGISFLNYITGKKIDEIKRLLTETDASVSDIANVMGYSTRNIYRIFYKTTNMSPAEYRVKNS